MALEKPGKLGIFSPFVATWYAFLNVLAPRGL